MPIKQIYDEMVKAYGDAMWLSGSSSHTSKDELIKAFSKAEDLALDYMDHYEAFDAKDERYNFANYISTNSHKEIGALLISAFLKLAAAEKRPEDEYDCGFPELLPICPQERRQE